MSRLDPAKRFRCPCCGYPTLDRLGAYEVCELCWWEEDGQNDPHAEEVWGGPNHGYSLAQARRNFQQFLVMYEPERDRRIGGPDSPTEHAAKRVLMAAFDQLTRVQPAERAAIVAEIYEQERQLRLETKRKLKEHDAQVRAAKRSR
jgi:hypothetical protein